jgi:uncharacterized protein (TIGR02271 family)
VTALTPRELERARRKRLRVLDPEGAHLGDVESVYYHDETGEPVWLGLRTELAPSGRVLVPLAGASRDGDELRVAHAKEVVQASPPVEGDRIDRLTQEGLAEHYGLAGPGLTRHEEELRVEKVVERAGVVRLRKRVESDREEREVERSVEQAGIERVPADADDSGLVETLPDGSLSVPVFEEELVVTKRLVVRERVIVRKETAIDVQSVGAEVRRERVEVEADPGVEVTEES